MQRVALPDQPSAKDLAALSLLGGDSALAAPPGRSAARVERPDARLEVPSYDLAAARLLARELGISHALAQILVRRGLGDAAAARAFLDPPPLHPPESVPGMADAVAVVRGHLAAGSEIVVHGDYDVDGVCATALLVRALERLGGRVRPFLPSRLEDGYGVSLPTVERLAARGTALLLTVDCGITAVEEAAAARAAGLDVVITDHHSPRADGRLPQAPVVHPGLADYPCPELCGTGVAFKLATALGAPGVEEELDLVALATVADLMPLRGENRRLVRDGLAALGMTARPGLRALMAVSGADPSEINAGTVGFRLAPRINAAGRLRRPDAALELLLTDNDERAAQIAAELDALNVERREVEQQILWQAEAQVHELGPRNGYVLAGEGWHPGVIGIVASRIVERFHRPTVLVALDAQGVGHGSGRSVPGFDLLAALHAAAPHLERYGGHRAAAGLTVRSERVAALRSAFEAHADEWLSEELRRPVERVDAILSGGSLGLELAEELELLEPCGMGNPAPKLLVPAASWSGLSTMGEGRHARFTISSGGHRARAVAFGCDGNPGVEEGEAVDATFRLERNVWKGSVEPRLVLRAVHRRAPDAITVLGEPSEYLAGLLAERGAPLPGGDPDPPPGSGRELIDRRGENPLAVLADARAAGAVLAVCADVPRRLDGLSARSGGFTLVCHHALERDPAILQRFDHLVVLDPPASRCGMRLLQAGEGFTHLAWGKAELGFSMKMHDFEYALRTPLGDVYRALVSTQRAAGETLERLLSGSGRQPRPARLAARLVRVLEELGLVRFDPATLVLSLRSAERTELERSAAYRAYSQRHQEGLECLARASQPALA